MLDPRQGLLAVALAACAWSLGAVAGGALLSRGVDPGQLAAARVVLTALGLAVVAARTAPRGGSVPLAHLLAFGTALGAVAVIFLSNIGRSGVAVGTVLHYLAPLVVVLWVAVAARRRPAPAVLGAAAASVVGVGLVSGAIPAGLGDLDALGLALGLASAACFAAYSLLAERVITAYGPVHALVRGFGIAAAAWVVVQALRGWPADLLTRDALPLVLVVGLLGTCLPFVLYLWGIQRVRADRAATAATLEPLVSGLLAWALLGQALTGPQILGGVVILAAVLALQLR